MALTSEQRQQSHALSETADTLLATIPYGRRQLTFEFLCDNLPEFLSTYFIDRLSRKHTDFQSEIEILLAIDNDLSKLEGIESDVNRIMIVTKLADLIGLDLKHYSPEEIVEVMNHLEQLENIFSIKFQHPYIISCLMKGAILNVSIIICHYFLIGTLSKEDILSGNIRVEGLGSQDKRIIKLAGAALNCLGLFDNERTSQMSNILCGVLARLQAMNMYKEETRNIYIGCLVVAITLSAILYAVFYFWG